MSTSTPRRPGGSPSDEAPSPGAADGGEVSERERALLARIAAAEDELYTSLLLYARYCQERRRPEQAIASYRRVLHAVGDGPDRAWLLLTLGQLCEKTGDFEGAAAVYAEGVRGDASNAKVAYFHRNNLGYSLNQLGRHAEAEALCRDAIALDPTRHNAHKNLAVSLEGQGRAAEAVASYLEAVELCPEDGRALDHLEELLAREPRLLDEVPGARDRLARGRRAVEEEARRRAN